MPTDGAANPKTSRRLAAILAADIAGYSAFMGADEEATVRDLRAPPGRVLPMIGGHIIDTEFVASCSCERRAPPREPRSRRTGGSRESRPSTGSRSSPHSCRRRASIVGPKLCAAAEQAHVREAPSRRRKWLLVHRGLDRVWGEKDERAGEHVEHRLLLSGRKQATDHRRDLLAGERFTIEVCERLRYGHARGSGLQCTRQSQVVDLVARRGSYARSSVAP
jgi:hypothetical protein